MAIVGIAPSMMNLANPVPTLMTNYNEKNNVHMKAMRPRTFDPTTMKSARRKISNLQKNQSQEKHF